MKLVYAWIAANVRSHFNKYHKDIWNKHYDAPARQKITSYFKNE